MKNTTQSILKFMHFRKKIIYIRVAVPFFLLVVDLLVLF
jgi:hypothetical protein